MPKPIITCNGNEIKQYDAVEKTRYFQDVNLSVESITTGKRTINYGFFIVE